jgi:hypothetical protein
MDSIDVKLTPVEYDAGPYPLYGGVFVIPDHIMQKDGSLRRNRVYISYRGSGWVICSNRVILRKDGEWDWEPAPSHRSEQLIKQTRFSTPEEAFAFWCETRKQLIKNGKQRDSWECEREKEKAYA